MERRCGWPEGYSMRTASPLEASFQRRDRCLKLCLAREISSVLSLPHLRIASMRNRFFLVSNESGQVLVAAAVSLVVILGFLGISIDVGHRQLSKLRLQSATDTAATAAALEIRVCGSLVSCPAMQSAVQSAFIENGYPATPLLLNCATSSADLTLVLNAPPCAMGTQDPNYGKRGYVEVQVAEQVPTYFMKMLGISQFNISARSEAARNPGGACIYALDPTAAGAMSIAVGLGINSQCGIVVESNSPYAFSCLLGLGFTAPYIKVHGGAAGLLCLGSGLQTNAVNPTPTDPLAYLPAPAVGACGAKVGNSYYGSASAVNIVLTGNYVFNPGVYCGGISITAAIGSNVTFNPGMYILKTGPGPLGDTVRGVEPDRQSTFQYPGARGYVLQLRAGGRNLDHGSDVPGAEQFFPDCADQWNVWGRAVLPGPRQYFHRSVPCKPGVREQAGGCDLPAECHADLWRGCDLVCLYDRRGEDAAVQRQRPEYVWERLFVAGHRLSAEWGQRRAAAMTVGELRESYGFVRRCMASATSRSRDVPGI